ncbi:hypothetical protein QO259_05675 [Salinicola sp. JS01]|uniref:hypothetical protein n=1 Tax=Salinicola sp. JS01 TaxID=3050071 RepID=UPI00255B8257|nr:hypothetical protein [Salinicola sp. JS01]WIX34152.1 hypothetical protein QO259_05675 [Salinicola sp. JS01]
MIQRTDALAESIGVSTQRLQEWQYASQEVGMDADKIGDIMKDVADKIGDAYRNGGGEAIDALNTLNLKAADLIQLSPDQTILKIAEGLQQLDRYSQVNVLESLGDDATLLQPLLENNAAALKQYASEARSLGVAMDQVDVDRAVEAARAMNQLQGVATGLSNSLIADLGPGLASATDNLTTLIEQAGGADEVLDVLMTTVGTLATVYLARRLGPGLLTVGKNGLAAGTQIAEGMAIALGATGRLNQALVVTQGRMAATAAAGRAMAGALSLVGGPAGAAILAAGAIYTYREELGLVDPLAEAADESIRGLAAAIRDGDKAALDSSFETLSLELESVSREAQNAMLDLQELEARKRFYDQSHGGVSDSLSGEISSQNQYMASLWARQVELMNSLEKIRQRREEMANAGAAGNGDEESSIKSLIKTYDEQHTKLVELRQDREAISQAMAADPKNAAQYRRMLAEVDQQIDKLTKTTKADSAERRKAEKAAKEQAQALEQLRRSLDPSYDAQQKLGESTAILNKGLLNSSLTLDEYLDLWNRAANTYIDSSDAAKEQAKRVDDLTRTYDAHERKARELELAVQDITEAYRRGDITGAQYQRMLANVRDEMRQLALESDPAAQEMARAWEEAANRIDETFADAFAGAFDGFDDFAGQLLDGFKRLLAELAYQALLRPIVVGFTADMQRGLGIPGATSGASTVGGINQVSGTIGDLGDYAQWGSKAWNVFGGGSAGASGGLYGNIASGSAAASGGLYGNVAASGGLYGNIATGSSAAGTGFMATAGSMVPQVAAAWAAQQALNAGLEGLGVYDWLGIDTSGAGAKWGGTLLGPVGTIGGAMLDGLFGGSRKFGFRFSQMSDNPHVTGQDLGYDTDPGDGTPWYSSGDYADGDLGRGRTTAFGSFGFLSKEVVEPDDLIKILDALEQADNALAQFMDDSQTSRIKEALNGFYYKGDDASDFMQKRMDIIVDQSNSAFEDAISQLGGNLEQQIQALAGGLQVESVGKNMASAVADEMNAQFREALADGSDIEAATQSIVMSAQAVELLGESADRLGLQFDATAKGALQAAGDLAEAAGGIQQLAAIHQSYYQAVYSDNERLSNSYQDLAAQFETLGVEMPNSAAALRDLVEAQDLNSDAGQKLQLQLMQLAPAFTQSTQSIRDALTEQYRDLDAEAPTTDALNTWIDQIQDGSLSLDDALSQIADTIGETAKDVAQQEAELERKREQAALESRISLYATGTVDAVEDALAGYDAAMSAAQAAAQEQRAAMESWRDAVRTVSQLADDLLLSDRSILDPLERLDEAQRQWVEQSVRAETNPDAASNLGQSGDAYLEALAAAYGQSSAEYAQGVLSVEDTYRSLEDLYGEQLDTLGSQESIAKQQLREEQRATAALRDQLTSLGNIGDLLGDLPTTLAQAIAEALPGYDPGSIGSGAGGLVSEDQFDTAAYLYNKTQQTNANAQGGRTDWTIDQVRERIMQDYGSIYQHYVQIGASEGVSPSYDGNDQSSGAAFDPDLYIARKRDQLNKSASQGKTDLTIDEVWAAFAESGLTPWEHSQLYGAKEGIDGYHRDGLDRVPYDGYRAVLHADEMVLTRDIADTVRAGMQSLDASRALPPAIVPPAFTGGGQSGSGQDLSALVRAVNRLSDDNAQLRGKLDALIAATGVVIDNTGAVIEPAERTAQAAESTNRAMRTRERSTT